MREESSGWRVPGGVVQGFIGQAQSSGVRDGACPYPTVSTPVDHLWRFVDDGKSLA